MLNQKGEMQFTTYLLIVALIVGGYVAVRLAPVYVRQFQIGALADTAAKFAADPSKKMTVPGFIARRIHDNELPIEKEAFVVEEVGENVVVSVDWDTQVEFIPENDFVPPVIRSFSYHYEAVEPINR